MTQLETVPERASAGTSQLTQWGYVVGACVLGYVNATLQGFEIGTGQWVGAGFSPLLVGAVIGSIRRAFGPTVITKWMLGWSVVALVVTLAGR